MAVRIRLMRMGTKKKPHYKIVVIDSRRARNSRFIEQIGFYDPCYEPPILKIKRERAAYWLKVGAKPTEIVASLFKKEDI